MENMDRKIGEWCASIFLCTRNQMLDGPGALSRIMSPSWKHNVECCARLIGRCRALSRVGRIQRLIESAHSRVRMIGSFKLHTGTGDDRPRARP